MRYGADFQLFSVTANSDGQYGFCLGRLKVIDNHNDDIAVNGSLLSVVVDVDTHEWMFDGLYIGVFGWFVGQIAEIWRVE